MKDFKKWNTGVSLMYAIGIWTMMGSYGYYKYKTRNDKKPDRIEEKEPANPNEVVHKTAHTKTTIVYKENFVPYTTRIYNFMKSFSEEAGTEDGRK